MTRLLIAFLLLLPTWSVSAAFDPVFDDDFNRQLIVIGNKLLPGVIDSIALLSDHAEPVDNHSIFIDTCSRLDAILLHQTSDDHFYEGLYQLAFDDDTNLTDESAHDQTLWLIRLLQRHRERNLVPEYNFEDHGLIQFVAALLQQAPPQFGIVVHDGTTLLRELLLYGVDEAKNVPAIFTTLAALLPPDAIADRTVGIRDTAAQFLQQRRGRVRPQTGVTMMFLLGADHEDQAELVRIIYDQIEDDFGDDHAIAIFPLYFFPQWVEYNESGPDAICSDPDLVLRRYAACLFQATVAKPSDWVRVVLRPQPDYDQTCLNMLRLIATSILGADRSRDDRDLIRRLLRKTVPIQLALQKRAQVVVPYDLEQKFPDIYTHRDGCYLHLAAQVAIVSLSVLDLSLLDILNAIKTGFGIEARSDRVGFGDLIGTDTELVGVADANKLIALALIHDPDWAASLHTAKGPIQDAFVRSVLQHSSALAQAVTYFATPADLTARLFTDEIIALLARRTRDYLTFRTRYTDPGCLECEALSSIESSKLCAICRGPMCSNHQAVMTCDHTFHQHCIEPWFRISRTCPVCRELLQADESSSSSSAEIDQILDEFVTEFRYLIGSRTGLPAEWIQAYSD